MITRSNKKSRFSLNRAVSMNEELSTLNSSFSHPIVEENEEDQNYVEKKQVKRQIGVFEEFKIKYDELRKENQEKRNEIDQLKKANKRLEIQLLNINTEFYDKQIQRLRAENDKLQEDSEDFKFKYFESENKRKQLESTLNVTQKQMAKIIKQFESEKVQNVELKHQLKENQKQYMSIITTVEESGMASSKRYTDCELKLNSVENELKQCKRELESEKKNLEKYEKTKNELDQEHKKAIEKLQILIKNIRKQLDDSEEQCRNYRKEISTLKETISETSLQMNKIKSLQKFETTKNFEKITQFKSSKLLEIENKRFRQENELIKKQLEVKTAAFKIIEGKYNELSQASQLEKKQNDQKLVDMQNKKAAIEKIYEGKNLSLSKEIEMLKIKCIKFESEEESKKHELNLLKLSHSQSNLPMFKRRLNEHQKEETPLLVFQNTVDEVIQNKEKQIEVLKRTLSEKIEEIYRLKEEREEQSIANENLRNEVMGLEKKLQVQQRNYNGKREMEVLEMRNKVDLLERRVIGSESKLQAKIKEVKEKDGFIVEWIVGRVKKEEEIPLIMVELQRVLESGYIEKLGEAEGKIKALELKLGMKGG